VRSTLSLLAALAALGVFSAPAGARTVPAQPPFRVLVVPHLSTAQLRHLADRGAVGLLVPGVGPTTNHRRALAAMLRGQQENARLGGVPAGPRLITAAAATGTPTGAPIIVVSLPSRGAPVSNDRRYPIAVIGLGYHGLLESPTTRIPGLVSVVDIAPTALGRLRGSLWSTPSADPIRALVHLDRQIHSNNRLKFAYLIVIAAFVSLLAIVRPSAAMPALCASLLASLGLGASGVANEVALMAGIVIATFFGGLLLSRVCRSETALLALFLGVLLVHMVLLAYRPTWVALSPLGPTQNSRFWGVGNQLETLLLPLLLAGAGLAGRRLGAPGFGAFALLALVVVTGNRFGSDGGGAIVLGASFAFLGSRLGRAGIRGFATALATAAVVALGVIWLDLRAGGPDHLRSAFSHGWHGLLAVAQNRVPLAYEPALHHWYLVLPFGIAFVSALALVLPRPHPAGRRDVLLALAFGIAVSLLVNDSAAYVLIGATAGVAALARARSAYAPFAQLGVVPAVRRALRLARPARELA
jgi:hypothetical protein